MTARTQAIQSWAPASTLEEEGHGAEDFRYGNLQDETEDTGRASLVAVQAAPASSEAPAGADRLRRRNPLWGSIDEWASEPDWPGHWAVARYL